MLRSLMLAALAALAFSSSPVKADNYYNAANIASDSQRTLEAIIKDTQLGCLLYTSPSPRDRQKSRMPSSA